jgi:actin related protein 2/3 complex subunit 2
VAKKVSLLKRNIFAVPFLAVAEGKTKNMVVLNYRSNEALYLKPEADSVTAIFSINFKDQDDIVLGKVFLQEFQDCRRSMSGAPAVSFAQKERPMELRDVPGVYEGADQGFVSFGTCASSFAPAQHSCPTHSLL